MIGAGVFIASGYALQESESILWVLICWVICAIISLCGGLTWSDLALMFPNEGGGDLPYLIAFNSRWDLHYVYLKILICNPMLTAVCSGFCTNFLLMVLGLEEIIKRIDNTHTNKGGAFWYDYLLYLDFCFLFHVLAYFLLSYSAKISYACSSALTIIKMGILAFFCVIGASSLYTGEPKSFAPDLEFSFEGYSRAFLIILYCYDGFANLSTVINLLEKPRKNSLKAIVTGCISVSFFYVVLNVMISFVLSIQELKDAKLNLAASFVSQCFKNIGLEFWGWENITNILVMVSVFGAMWGISFTSSELTAQAMKNTKMASYKSVLQINHPLFKTNDNAILFHLKISVVYTCLMILPKVFNFYHQTSFLINWVFYVITAAGLFSHRFKKKSQRIRVFFPLVVILTGIFVFIVKLMNSESRYHVLFLFLVIMMHTFSRCILRFFNYLMNKVI